MGMKRDVKARQSKTKQGNSWSTGKASGEEGSPKVWMEAKLQKENKKYKEGKKECR